MIPVTILVGGTLLLIAIRWGVTPPRQTDSRNIKRKQDI